MRRAKRRLRSCRASATSPVKAALERNITLGNDVLSAYDHRVDQVFVLVSFFLDDYLNARTRMLPVLPLPRPFAELCHLVDCQLSLRHTRAMGTGADA